MAGWWRSWWQLGREEGGGRRGSDGGGVDRYWEALISDVLSVVMGMLVALPLHEKGESGTCPESAPYMVHDMD